MIKIMNISIERAKVDDVAVILRLQILAYQSEAEIYNNYKIPPLTQTLAEIEEEFRTLTFLVARQDGKIIGSVRASCRDGRCVIEKLIVHPDHQRQGLGSQLVTAIEATFPEAKHFELFTGHRSERNLRLYNRLGYREFKRKQIAPGLIVVYLEKPNAAPASNR